MACVQRPAAGSACLFVRRLSVAPRPAVSGVALADGSSSSSSSALAPVGLARRPSAAHAEPLRTRGFASAARDEAKRRRGGGWRPKPAAVPLTAGKYVPAAASMSPEPGLEAFGEASSGVEGGRGEQLSGGGRGAARALGEDLDFVFEEVALSEGAREGSGDAASSSSSSSSRNGDHRGGASSQAAFAASLQARLANAKSAGHVLEVAAAHLDAMDARHAVTALHRLARHTASRGRKGGAEHLARTPTAEALLDRLGRSGSLEAISAQGQCCLLWALSRLRARPSWLPKLMESCAASSADFTSHQLATALHALASLEGLPGPQEPRLRLIEALHQEIRRRSRSFGPGGTSALDAVLMADALAKLQIRDEGLFGALAEALRLHLQAGSLEVRSVRHVATAFALAGFVDAGLSEALCTWLEPRAATCAPGDLAAITAALARVGDVAGAAHARLFQSLQPEIQSRAERGEFGAKDAGRLLHAFSQAAGGADADLTAALAEALARSPASLNGNDLALVVPSLGPEVARARPGLLEALAGQTVRCAGVLSPRQLALLACGFGDVSARSAELWSVLGRGAHARAHLFAAPDLLRVLAGLDAAPEGALDQEAFRAIWAAVEAKGAERFLTEETLALLQLWPRLAAAVRRERPALLGRLLGNLRERVVRGDRGGWQLPPDLAAELLEWMPQSRDLHPNRQLDGKLLRASLRLLPGQVKQASVPTWLRLLAALSGADGELLARARAELQQRAGLRRACEDRVTHYVSTPYDMGAAAVLSFRCAALGMDFAQVRELLRALLGTVAADAAALRNLQRVAQICWACAELRVHGPEARGVLATVAPLLLQASDDDTEEGEEGDASATALGHLRLAWSSLALGGESAEVAALAAPTLAARDSHQALLRYLSAADVRPARQLAWHLRRSGAQADGELAAQTGPGHENAAANDAGRAWAEAVLAYEPSFEDYEAAVARQLSELLQQMRVPHVASSPVAAVRGIYRAPAWFPQPKAVLDVDARGDRLASGALGGGAALRRKQLQRCAPSMPAC
eukprot:TRINITY_DN17122_c0_g2_i1.p1 TRINITY_DN17122_c0_g2~~TRINITY_DN17122_c0_g2_i1.p1  ORF type:complete len:1059 (-),score=233.92 TRINITY_DN17122_c0_g2_i1:228-3335(-)